MGKGQISRITDFRSVCFLVLFYFLFSAANSDAHPGRKDSQGGHHQRATGTYHFHDGPLVGQTFASKAAGSAALAGGARSVRLRAKRKPPANVVLTEG